MCYISLSAGPVITLRALASSAILSDNSLSTMSSTSASASIQYTVALLTVPLVRAKVISRTTASSLRTSLRNDLVALASSPDFQISISCDATILPFNCFLVACMKAGIKWSTWMQHLGGAPLTLVISRSAVIANKRSVWKAEKPTIPSEAISILGLSKKDNVELTPRVVTSVKEVTRSPAPAMKMPMPKTPIIQGIDNDMDEFSVVPITPMTALPKATILRSPSPFSSASSEASTDSDNDDTFSDVTDSDDDISSVPIRSYRRDIPQRAIIKAFKYDEGETTVLSGGVLLGMPSVAYLHSDMQGDDDEFFDELPQIVTHVSSDMDATTPRATLPSCRLASSTPSVPFTPSQEKYVPAHKKLLPRSNMFKARQGTGASLTSGSWRARV